MATTYLARDFIDKRLTWISHLPEEWDLPNATYYHLNLKMCQLNRLLYNFQWYDDRVLQPKIAAAVDHPSKILELDISINDIAVLDFDSLLPFRNLRRLNASINRLESCPGLECCQNLEHLNLSHNFLQHVDGLSRCGKLIELRLSQNNIINIRTLPRLSSLKILHLDHNQVESIKGIHVLTNIKELYIQKNRIATLMPLSGCIQLKLLNAGDNIITDLRETSEVLRNLKRLDHLNLKGNPVTEIPIYRATMIEALQVTFLDGENVRPAVNPTQSNTLKSNINTIVGVAKRIHIDQIEAERDRMNEDIRLLQLRMMERQEEFREYESKMKQEMDSTVTHLDHLPESFPEIKILRPGRVEYVEQEPFPTLIGIPLRKEFSRRGTKSRPRYGNVTETNELLRYAFNELCREQESLNSLHES